MNATIETLIMIKDFLFLNEAASLFLDPDPCTAGGTQGGEAGALKPVCAGPGGFHPHCGS